MSKKILKYVIYLMVFSFSCNNAQPNEGNDMNSKTYKIKITIGDNVLNATLNDNPSTRDFIKLLPLNISLEDYAGTEKIFYLKEKLSVDSSTKGYEPKAGDITYYSPWGNVAIFYKNFGYANGLIHLGTIEGNFDIMKNKNNLNAKIELIK